MLWLQFFSSVILKDCTIETKALASATAFWHSRSVPMKPMKIMSSLYDFRPDSSALSNDKVSTKPKQIDL